MLTLNRKMEISESDIDYLMICALEGGINYWCNECRIKKNPAGHEYASEILAYGGVLELVEDEDGTVHTLTRKNFLKGVVKAMDHFQYGTVKQMMDEHDATTADVIVQFALFGEIVYG